MQLKKTTTYFTGVILLLTIIVTVIIVSIRQTEDLRNINQEISTSFEITELADKVLTLSIDNETGARGYLLTGDENFLTPFENAKTNLSIILDSLKQATEISQKNIVDSIILYALKRFEFSQKMINIRRKNSLEASVNLYNADDGRGYMDKIRLYVSALTQQQKELLNDDKSNSNESFERLTLIQYLIVSSALVLIILLGYKFRSDAIKTKIDLENFMTLIDASPDANVIVNQKGEIILVNKQTELLFRYDRNELLGKQVEILIPENKRTKHIDQRKEFTKSPHTRLMGSGLELSAIRKDGSSFPVEVSLAPVKTTMGMLVSASLRDVTEKQKATEQLKTFNEQLEQKVQEQTLQIRSILESISDSFIAFNQELVITYANKTAAHFFKQQPEALVNIHLKKILPPHSNKPFYDLVEKGMLLQQKVQGEVYDAVTDNWLHHYVYPSENLITVYTRNINEEKRREKETEIANEDLRRLSAHLQQIREEERKNIARDLHDDLGQQLTGLQMDVHWMQKKLQNTEPHLIDKMNEINEMVDHTIRAVRRILADLRPAILDDLGMIAAMEWLNQETSKRYPVQIHFKVNTEEINLSPDSASALFRIYQEGINNAIKHANAKNINAGIEVMDHQVKMYITDDGKGINTEKQEKGYGLLGIKERTYILGGTFSVQSEQGKGTSLIIHIPLV